MRQYSQYKKKAVSAAPENSPLKYEVVVIVPQKRRKNNEWYGLTKKEYEDCKKVLDECDSCLDEYRKAELA